MLFAHSAEFVAASGIVGWRIVYCRALGQVESERIKSQEPFQYLLLVPGISMKTLSTTKRGQEPFNDISLVPGITEHKDPCHARKGS